jgi:hypothetical protein
VKLHRLHEQLLMLTAIGFSSDVVNFDRPPHDIDNAHELADSMMDEAQADNEARRADQRLNSCGASAATTAAVVPVRSLYQWSMRSVARLALA